MSILISFEGPKIAPQFLLVWKKTPIHPSKLHRTPRKQRLLSLWFPPWSFNYSFMYNHISFSPLLLIGFTFISQANWDWSKLVSGHECQGGKLAQVLVKPVHVTLDVRKCWLIRRHGKFDILAIDRGWTNGGGITWNLKGKRLLKIQFFERNKELPSKTKSWTNDGGRTWNLKGKRLLKIQFFERNTELPSKTNYIFEDIRFQLCRPVKTKGR